MKLPEKRKIVTRKIFEKAIEMLETALQGENETMAFADTLLNLHDDVNLKHYTQFYYKYKSLYGLGIRPKDALDPNSFFPMFLDNNLASSSEANVPKKTRSRYAALMSKMDAWKNNNTYPEKYFSLFDCFDTDDDLVIRQDYLYMTGLLLTPEELGVSL